MADGKPAVLETAAASTLFTRISDRARPNAKLIALLALGHFTIDLNQGALPAILPFLKSAHNLSYAAAGTIVLVANVASSIIQPIFGYFSDLTARRWILPISVLLCGTGVAAMGVAPSYLALLALVVVMGLGAAAYHPEGYKTVGSVAGDRKVTAVSWFSAGGNAGVALGPIAIATLVPAFGLGGSLGLMVPTAIVTLAFFAALPRMTAAANRAAADKAPARGDNMPWAMALLVLVVTIRSWTTLGFSTFVPFYYIDYLKADPRIVGPLLFVFLGFGAAGTVIVGPFADRVGPRRFMTWAFLLATPFTVLFLTVTGPLAFVMLALVGVVLVSSFTVSVVLAQQYLPRNTGMASGLVVGFASGTGSLGVTLLGWIADHHGLLSALWISALMPLLAFVAAWFLPAPRARA
jgi:FSR family fosmidomycin resistance protein-like MFS transporter